MHASKDIEDPKAAAPAGTRSGRPEFPETTSERKAGFWLSGDPIDEGEALSFRQVGLGPAKELWSLNDRLKSPSFMCQWRICQWRMF